MRIRVDTGNIRQSHWYGHLLRFGLGGAITALAGLVAKGFGPTAGGFLLAFPAILPAALMLTVRLHNEQVGREARGDRGRRAAVLTAAGAATACPALLSFALVTWRGLGRAPAWLVIGAATIAWTLVAAIAWLLRKRGRRWPGARRYRHPAGSLG